MKMKKLFMVLTLVLSIALAGNVMAGSSVNVGDNTYAPTGNQYSGTASENTAAANFKGWGLALGGTGTDGKAFSTGYVERIGRGTQVATSFGAADVHSNAWGAGLGFGKGDYDLGVSGAAWAGNDAYASTNGNHPTEAGGGSWAEGSYDASKAGKVCFIGGGSLNGDAKALAGTIAFSERDRGDFTASAKSGAATGSFANASHDGSGTTIAQGAGSVFHNTLAQPKLTNASASTYGNAGYDFYSTGGNNATGGGFAATKGYSTVTQNPNSSSSHTRSFGMAFSTGGSVDPQ